MPYISYIELLHFFNCQSRKSYFLQHSLYAVHYITFTLFKIEKYHTFFFLGCLMRNSDSCRRFTWHSKSATLTDTSRQAKSTSRNWIK